MIRRYADWTTQPQEPVGIDWGNPINEDLATASIPGVASILMYPQKSSSTLASSRELYKFGYALRKPIGNTAGLVFNSPGHLVTSDGAYTGDFTILFLGKAEQNTTRGVAFFQIQESGGFPCVAFGTNMTNADTDSSGTLGVSIFNGGWQWEYASGVVVANESAAFACRRKTGVPGLFKNGVQLSVSSGSGGGSPFSTGAVGSSSAQIVIQGRPNNSTPGIDLLSGVWTWNRALSDTEIASISDNPWQLFAPRSIWVPNAEAFASSRFNKPLYLAPTRTVQPQKSVNINWGNPITRDLVLAPVMWQNGMEIASKNNVSLSPNSSIISTPLGLALKGSGTYQQGLQISTVGIASSPFTNFVPDSSNLTIIMGTTPFATGVREVMLADYPNGGSSSSVYIEQTSGNQFTMGMGGAVTTGTVIADKFTTLSFTRDAINVNGYVNGVAGTPAARGTASVGYNTHIGAPGTYTGGLNFRGSILYFYVWRRCLSVNELNAVHANPWQLFAPQEKFIQTAYTPKAPWSVTKSRMLGTGTGAPAQVAFASTKKVINTVQPQGSGSLDKNSNLFASSIECWTPTTGLYSCSGSGLTLTPGSGTTVRSGMYGVGWLFDGNANKVLTATEKATRSFDNSVWFAVFEKTAQSVGGNGGLYISGTGAYSVGVGEYFTGGSLKRAYLAVGGQINTGTVAYNTGLVVVCGGQTDYLNSFVTYSENGLVLTTSGSTDSSTFTTLSIGGVYLNGKVLLAGRITADKAAVGRWKANSVSFCNNPWQLFSPRSVQIPVGVNL